MTKTDIPGSYDLRYIGLFYSIPFIISATEWRLYSLQRFNDLVAPYVEFRIFTLQFRMRHNIRDSLAYALVKMCRRTETRHGTLPL